MARVNVDELVKVLLGIQQFDVVHHGAGEHAAEDVKKLVPVFEEVSEHVDDARVYSTLKPYIAAVKRDNPTKSAIEKLQKAAEEIEDIEGINVDDDKQLLQSFENAEKRLKDVAKDRDFAESFGKLKTLQAKLASPFGMVQTEGVSKAAEHHLTKWEGRTWQGFGRCAGTALCAVGLADGIFRAKTDNGEDRNVATRFGEVALCALGAAALVLAGKAHGAQALKV